MKFLFVIIGVILFCDVVAQRKQFDRVFQISLAPALSSNGLHPGGYQNVVSINLTSGYSAANYLFELSGISSLNRLETRGLQISGIANVTGGNAFQELLPKEIDKLKKEGFEANLSGIQIAGVTNVVLNNVFGGQITGAVNVAGGALQGVQIGGVMNVVKKYSFGVQLAGIANSSVESMSGIQLSSLINATEGSLAGFQIALINLAGTIEGINSFERTQNSALQLGLFNRAQSMNGFQIGLVNIGRRMQGTQIGLINIFRDGKTPETRGGTSIGLVNIGSAGYLSVYANELFSFNVEVATGNNKNGRVKNDAFDKQVQNGLIYARNVRGVTDSERWGLGYGLKKVYFNRAEPGRNRLNFFSAGLDLIHINHQAKEITKELSMVVRPNVQVGSRFHPKNMNFYFFAGAAYSFYKTDGGNALSTIVNQERSLTKDSHWPGFSAGVMIQ